MITDHVVSELISQHTRARASFMEANPVAQRETGGVNVSAWNVFFAEQRQADTTKSMADIAGEWAVLDHVQRQICEARARGGRQTAKQSSVSAMDYTGLPPASTPHGIGDFSWPVRADLLHEWSSQGLRQAAIAYRNAMAVDIAPIALDESSVAPSCVSRFGCHVCKDTLSLELQQHQQGLADVLLAAVRVYKDTPNLEVFEVSPVYAGVAAGSDAPGPFVVMALVILLLDPKEVCFLRCRPDVCPLQAGSVVRLTNNLVYLSELALTMARGTLTWTVSRVIYTPLAPLGLRVESVVAQDDLGGPNVKSKEDQALDAALQAARAAVAATRAPTIRGVGRGLAAGFGRGRGRGLARGRQAAVDGGAASDAEPSGSTVS